MNRERPTDWFAFAVRFFFGALLGLLISCGCWVRLDTSGSSIWILPTGAIVVGLVAARWGDDFWHALRYLLWWLP
jgi:hypothetical protein